MPPARIREEYRVLQERMHRANTEWQYKEADMLMKRFEKCLLDYMLPRLRQRGVVPTYITWETIWLIIRVARHPYAYSARRDLRIVLAECRKILDDMWPE